MEAVGKYDFDASSADQLSFREGDVLKILSSHDSWYAAEMHGQEGLVPQNYLDVQIPRWFQENASRSVAEEVLIDKGVGHFLIRGSQSSPGDFSISVRHEHDVQHFKVIKDNKGHYFLWSKKFCSFNKLVDFYKTSSISKQRLIFLNDDTEDSRTPVTDHKNVGFVEQEPTNQFVVAGRQSPVAAVVPAAVAQRVAPIQMRVHPSEVRVAPLQVRVPPPQVRVAPLQVRVPPPQVRAAPVQVKALYNFKVEEDDELGFSAGDVIEVLDYSDASWWTGRLRGKCGLFPANYTTPL